jgi:cation diffusion facilitator family transporter
VKIAIAKPFEIPEDKKNALQRARRIEWASLAALVSIVLLLAFVMGASQTMKAMWVEDTLSLIPSMAFLIGFRFRQKQPDEEFPYGYRRAVLIGFLCGAVALFGFGVYLFGDSVFKLIKREHPTVQTIGLFGTRVWLGWVMIAAMIYSVIPPFILGRMKQPLAKELHDKSLQTSAVLDKGDWLSGLAGVAGLLGIAWGFWWADSAAAAFISYEIIGDGWENLRNSVEQLMNKRPTQVESKEPDPTPQKVSDALERLPWVQEARVRLREDGDVFVGEAFIIPRDEDHLLDRVHEAAKVAESVDWRMHEISIVPVRSFD